MKNDAFNEIKEYNSLIDQMNKDKQNRKNKSYQICGTIDTGRAHMMWNVSDDYRFKIITTYSEQRAREIYDDIKHYAKASANGTTHVRYYPTKDFIFYNADMQAGVVLKDRLRTIKAIESLQAEDKLIIVTTIDGLMDKVPDKTRVFGKSIHIESGITIEPQALSSLLISYGYERTSQVQVPGQYAIRGSIIDIYTQTDEMPYRIDLWDDEVDTVKRFEPDSQRTIDDVDYADIFPATEYVLSDSDIEDGIVRISEDLEKYKKSLQKQKKAEEVYRISAQVNEFIDQMKIQRACLPIDGYVNYFYSETCSFIDYFDRDETIIIEDEPLRIIDKMGAVELEYTESMTNRLQSGYILPLQADIMWDSNKVLSKCSAYNNILFTILDQKMKGISVDYQYHFSMRNVNPYNNSMETLIKDLKMYLRNKYKIQIISSSKARAERLADALRDDFAINSLYIDKVDRPLYTGEVAVSYGNIHIGYEYPDAKLVVIAETDIFGHEKRKKKKSKYSGQKIADFSQLNVGDYVVHENHGLGIYQGIVKMDVDKTTKDYIKIGYADNSNLYILATQLDLLQKYASSDAKVPKINKLGTREWSNTKSRVRSAVKDIAGELVNLYATRQNTQGYRYSEDTVWQREFEELFPYEETEDQLDAIEDTKKDMESHKIMDRLVCGDVGYGKTEIAIRAAFKAVQDGKQVVFLVPTTILAQQHFNTFTQRMKDYPIEIELLSRFRTKGEQDKAIDRLKKGFVDIVIGTHRVLSKDVQFKDLGLLIIDEEQRFGVANKEKIKQLKANVDVLTLTATPIPRTLHMSLVGIRDMSILEEPPVDRVPIQTYVMEYNPEMVREAINRELARGGQVYYVYNKVNSIEDITSKIAALVPDAVVAYAHGQMSERRLEQIMMDFINGDIDVLVSTTIIETGLDISNVNTMIIHDSDKLGLSQLYQLRGRIGRSNRTAYAFLMYKRDRMLKEIAEKRLQAIREFTELGSGFKIAMRDLELRGAGNVLGAEQHGHMEAVGYDLYCKMLNEAVGILKKQKDQGYSDEDTKEKLDEVAYNEDYETTIDISVDAYIPPTYIANEMQKLEVYRKIAGIENESEYDDILDELIDRFGEPPRAVLNLLRIALLRTKAHSQYINEISGDKTKLKIVMYQKANIDVNKIPEFVKSHRNHMTFTADKNPYFIYTPEKQVRSADDLFGVMAGLFREMESMQLQNNLERMSK